MKFRNLGIRLERIKKEKQRTGRFEFPRGRPFWIWEREQHMLEDIRRGGMCCFNHSIGLPEKGGSERPFYDYQKLIYDALFDPDFRNPLRDPKKYKHVWIKKATGLGITELMLRLMAWLCLNDDTYKGTQMCIVTGPGIEPAISLIDRMKGLFKDKFFFDTKETVINLNGVRIAAFPSHNLNTMRGLDNVSFILFDEADFFARSEQMEARNVAERYIIKSDPYIVFVSTPNAPGGLFETIERELESTCMYKRIMLDYKCGLGKIYSSEEIDKGRLSSSFEREYNLKYIGTEGNVFSTKSIEEAIAEYDTENYSVNYHAPVSMGIDCGFGSSPFGIVILRLADGRVEVLFADEFERPDYNEMLEMVLQLRAKYQVRKVFVDGANPEFIRSLKRAIGERQDPTKYMERSRKYSWPLENYMSVIPVPFVSEHKQMITRCKMVSDTGSLRIHPKFEKLLVSLRTAVERDGILDKDLTSYNDIFDAFRLALKYHKFTNV